MKQTPTHIASSITINSLRFMLAMVFMFSGFVKAIDPMGTVYKMADYAEAFGWGTDIPMGVLFAAASTLIIIEYIIGTSLFFGLYRRFYLWLMIAFLGIMTPLTLYIAVTNPISDCGCFGEAITLTNWQTFGKNLLLLATAIVTLRYNQLIKRLIPEHSQWFIFVYALGTIILFMGYNLRHLPIADFRPYHIGANIIDKMTIPDDAPQNEYETLFVYEKDGEKRTFTFDEYPDSTWTFVSRESKLIAKGYEPPIKDFKLTDMGGNDLTMDILEHPHYTCLMIAERLEYANEGMLDVINDLYAYTRSNNIPFYMVTTSNRESINQWTEHTGALYPYLQADANLLRTMIRANLGLILLHNGTIVGKWSSRDIPRDKQLNESIENNTALTITSDTRHYRQLVAVVWMIIPLLLICLWTGRRRKE